MPRKTMSRRESIAAVINSTGKGVESQSGSRISSDFSIRPVDFVALSTPRWASLRHST